MIPNFSVDLYSCATFFNLRHSDVPIDGTPRYGIKDRLVWASVLRLVKAIVEAHQGTASVESAIGKGATFIVKLPLA
jgi:hypothetical protein